MVDWRADVEKKLNNLVRSVAQDIRARGDAGVLADLPGVERQTDGSYRVIVFRVDAVEETPTEEPSRKRKKKDED